MAAFYNDPSDLWTPGYDQFGISCWQNRVTRELRYLDTPARQPPVLTPPAFAGDPYYPHLPIGRPLQHAARPPADRLPPWRDRKVQFQTPALNVPKPAAATGWSILSAPTVMEPRSSLPFPPSNFARPTHFTFLPKVRPSPKKSSKKIKNEANQWFLQRNGKGEEYYLNTSTWQWQYETPDCLKKYTTRR